MDESGDSPCSGKLDKQAVSHLIPVENFDRYWSCSPTELRLAVEGWA
jgi:hypothetical protein